MIEALLPNDAVVVWIAVPLLIFLARTIDMSIDTVRVIVVARGNRLLAPILGFVEILIWLLAIGQVFRHLDNPAAYIGYAGGYAAGNYIGMRFEAHLAMGSEILRLITRRDAAELVTRLRSAGYGLTVVPGMGATGPVSILFMVVDRRSIGEILKIAEKLNPPAFYSIEDVRSVSAGVFPSSRAYFWRRAHRAR